MESPENILITIGLILLLGVAMGMGLLAAERFPQLKDVILTVVIGTTIFFELVGPVCTRIALARAGKIRNK